MYSPEYIIYPLLLPGPADPTLLVGSEPDPIFHLCVFGLNNLMLYIQSISLDHNYKTEKISHIFLPFLDCIFYPSIYTKKISVLFRTNPGFLAVYLYPFFGVGSVFSSSKFGSAEYERESATLGTQQHSIDPLIDIDFMPVPPNVHNKDPQCTEIKPKFKGVVFCGVPKRVRGVFAQCPFYVRLGTQYTRDTSNQKFDI